MAAAMAMAMAMAPTAQAWRALPLLIAGDHADGGALRVGPAALRALQQEQETTDSDAKRKMPPGTRHIRVLGLMGPPHTGKRVFLSALLGLHLHKPLAREDDNELEELEGVGVSERVLLWLYYPDMGTYADSHSETMTMVVAADMPHLEEQPQSAGEQRAVTALMLLLSSTVVYNEEGAVDAPDGALSMARLGWLSEICESLRVTPQQDAEGTARVWPEHAPTFVWLVRNAKMQWLVDEATRETMTADEYVERCLVEEPGFSDAVAERNALRMYILSLFPRRHGVTMSRAMTAATAASFVEQNGGEGAAPPPLREAFVKDVGEFREGFLGRGGSKLPVKTVMQSALTLADWIVALQVYVAALTKQTLPCVQVAAHAVLARHVEARFADAKRAYNDAMADVAGKEHGVPTRELEFAHRRGIALAMCRVQNMKLPESVRKSVFKAALEELTQMMTDKRDSLKSSSEAHAVLAIEHALETELHPVAGRLARMAAELEARTDTLSESARADAFGDGLVALLTQYKADLCGAVTAFRSTTDQLGGTWQARETALEIALRDAAVAAVRAWGVHVLSQYQSILRGMLAARAELEQQVAIVTAPMGGDTITVADGTSEGRQNPLRMYELQVEQETQRLAEVRRALESERDARQRELDRVESALASQEGKHDARVAHLEREIAWARERMSETERQAATARVQMAEDEAGVKDEVLTHTRHFREQERTLRQEHRELLARVVELEREVVAKKTRHVQLRFELEARATQELEQVRREHAAQARQLRTQAKTDIGVLRRVLQSKQEAVRREITGVARMIEEAQIALGDKPPPPPTMIKRKSTLLSDEQLQAADAAGVTMPTAKVRVNTAVERPAPLTRSDTDMCKTQ